MRFQCLDVTCGKAFGWTAKKIVTDGNVTYEYVVCPYCGSLNFDETTLPRSTPLPTPKKVPPVQLPTPATKSLPEFDPADLMNHQWKGKKLGHKKWETKTIQNSYAWDFADKFKPETVAALPLTLDNYEFALKDKIVSFKKVNQ